MYPSFQILGKTIPSYWLCALLGIIVCSLVGVLRRKNFSDLEQVDLTNTAALACVGMVIGGRVLFLITVLPAIIRNIKLLMSDLELAFQLLSSGLVAYGGLLGALCAIWLYARRYKLDMKSLFDFFAPLFPLFHAFGRVGCFLTGCCYGVESQALGIAFHSSEIAPNGVSLFPVQLLASALNLALFFIVLGFEKKHHRQGKAMGFYLVIYAAGRFMIEFLRGDSARGFIIGLSTSQWISVIVLAVMACIIIKKKKEKGDGYEES